LKSTNFLFGLVTKKPTAGVAFSHTYFKDIALIGVRQKLSNKMFGHPISCRRLQFNAALSVLVAAVLIAAITPDARASNIAVDEASRLVLGAHVLKKYQYYQKTPADTPRDIHAIMAPLIGVINQGLKAGLNTADLLAVHDQVVQTAAHEAGFMAA